MISADTARERYEPLIGVLAEQLALEFGMEWRRSEVPPGKGRRMFRTTRWVTDQPLSQFSGWARRLETTVERVFDIVGSGTPVAVLDSVLQGLDDESPAEGQVHIEAQQLKPERVVRLDGDEPLLLPLIWSVRDRQGGDIEVSVNDSQTSLCATATVSSR